MYKATHRFVDMAPTKVRLVVNLVRGDSVAKALDKLKFLPNRGARFLEKVLRSAVANAAERGARGVDKLEIVDIRVDEGPRMKRIQPRARGIAFPIIKRMCHIKVQIDEPKAK
jgi:large subunit ribosomal protein L22